MSHIRIVSGVFNFFIFWFNKMPFFVEVGSCNFDTCQQLIDNGWDGLVIEPVKYYFDKLPKVPRIHYENVAVDSQAGSSHIHYIDPQLVSEQWERGISSLQGSTGPLSLAQNCGIDRFANALRQPVDVVTLNSLCTKYDIEKIDFLKVDTEGADLRVLQSLDLSRVDVRFIKVEHKHCDAAVIERYLHGYMIYRENDDIYAIK